MEQIFYLNDHLTSSKTTDQSELTEYRVEFNSLEIIRGMKLNFEAKYKLLMSIDFQLQNN